jgi:hypothetical protein
MSKSACSMIGFGQDDIHGKILAPKKKQAAQARAEFFGISVVLLARLGWLEKTRKCVRLEKERKFTVFDMA